MNGDQGFIEREPFEFHLGGKYPMLIDEVRRRQRFAPREQRMSSARDDGRAILMNPQLLQVRVRTAGRNR